MPNKETTTKFKVDISELKKNITEANRLIRLNNSEFKAASAGMDKWSDNANGLTAKLKQLNGNLDQEKVKLKSLEEQYKLVCDAQGKDSKGAQDLLIKINNQKAAISKTENQINTYTAKLKDVEEQNKKSESATEKLSTAIKNQEEQLGKLKSKYAEVILTEGKNSEKAKELKSEIEKLSTELNKNKTSLNNAKTSADKFDKSLDKVEESSTETANSGLSTFNVALGNLAADGLAKALEKTKELVTEVVEVGKSFESSMSNVAAISGANKEELSALTDKAKEMGANTIFSASEASDAMSYMAMAGWKTEDMLNGISGVLDLAASSGSDLATTSDIVTDALTAMGYGAKSAGQLADVMAATASNANTNTEMMGETFKYAAAVAGALGYKMEDVALATGIMANAGIKGSQAGTALRSIITRLSTDAGASNKSLGALGTLTHKLGVEFYNADGSARDLGAVLSDTRKAWKGLTDEEKTNYAKKIAGQEAISGFLALMNTEEKDYNKLTKAIKNSNGASKKMSDTMQNNLDGDMKALNSKIESIQIKLYEKFSPALRQGVEDLEKFAESAEAQEMLEDLGEVLADLAEDGIDAIEWVLTNLDKIVPILKGIGTELLIVFAAKKLSSFISSVANMVTTFKSLKTATEGATTAQKLLNIAQKSNPIGLVISIIGGLVTAFTTLTDVMGDAEDESKKDFTPETTEAKRQVDELAQSWKDFKTARDEAIQDTQGQWDYYDKLNRELQGLIDKNGKVKKKDKERAEFIVNTLNDALGKEIVKIKGLKVEYQKSAKAVEKLMQKEKARAMLSAYEQSYTDAIKYTAEGSDTKKAYDTSYKAYQKAVNEYKKASKELEKAQKKAEKSLENPAKGNYGEDAKKALAAKEKYDKAKTNLYGNGKEDGILKTWEKARNAYNEALNTVTNYEKLNEAILSNNSTRINNYLGAIAGNFKSFGSATYYELLTQRNNYKSAFDKIKQAFKNGAEGVTDEQVKQAEFLYKQANKEFKKADKQYSSGTQNIFKSVNQKAKKGGKDLVDAVDYNSGATAKATYKGLIKVKEKGVSGAKSATNATAKAIKDNSDKVSNAAKDTMKGAAKSAKSVKTYSIGSNFINGIISAFKNNKLLRKIVDGATNIAKKAYGTVKKWLGIESPSKKTKELGKYFMMGFDVGADEESKKTQANLKKRFGDVVKSAQSSVTGTDLPVNLNVPNSINRSKNSGQANSGNTVVNNYYYHNYTQNNTSPKALDELTIYRQSKNLLNLNK